MRIEVDLYQLIRHKSVVEGLSQRRIARELGIARQTVKKYCEGTAMPWERKTPKRDKPVVTAEVLSFIERCFEEDKTAPNKQHHTAHRIFERLRDEMGFQGAEPTIRRQVAAIRRKMPEVYIPLQFAPGEAAQIDWGQAVVIMAGVRRTVELFCFRLCFSCAPYVMAFPSQREEAFLEGHQIAFEYFSGVPRVCIYDNLKTAVKEGWGKHAKEQKAFFAFRSHHAFTAEFCNPGEGHEKGLVENLVGWARRNVLVPVPVVKDFNELNQMLLLRCQSYLGHTIRGREESVETALQAERTQLISLPIKPFDVARVSETAPDYFSLAIFDGNKYSVPVELAGQTLTVKGYGHRVKVYHRETEVAVHERLYGKGKVKFEVAHYLRLLEMKPRAVFHAKPVRAANLPGVFMDFAKSLPGPELSMVRLLRLAVDNGVDRVAEAVAQASAAGARSVEVVQYYLGKDRHVPVLPAKGPRVEPPDLNRYDLLLGGGQK